MNAPAPTTRTCPFCASDETRTVQSIYDIAKNYSRSSLSRVAVTGGAGFYLGGSNVRPTEDTIRAAKFPPPPRPRFSWWTFVSVVLTVACAYFCLGGIAESFRPGRAVRFAAGHHRGLYWAKPAASRADERV
jgi:hypothetical protein